MLTRTLNIPSGRIQPHKTHKWNSFKAAGQQTIHDLLQG